VGRFPGADDVEAFWRNLRDGVESVIPLSDRELLAAGVSLDLLKHPDYVKAYGVLTDIDLFDAEFFNITPREAETMDPQHRLFLETAWHALEHAGYDPETPAVSIGVFAGSDMNTYLLNNLLGHAALQVVGTFQSMLGNDKDYLPTRVSYKLNLHGP